MTFETTASGPAPTDQFRPWPSGEGEMARRVRAHDWSVTPLGPTQTWPASLRTVVDLLLASGFPAVALWGPELIQIYNDAARPLMGGKHPAALGQSTSDCWPEIAPVNEPIYARVRAGETLTFEDKHYRIVRDGAPEDAWFTLTYSPLRDESGVVAGVFVNVFETTAQILAARRRDAAEAALREAEARQSFLLRLADATRPLADPSAIQRAAARLLREHLRAGRALYTEIEGDEAVINHDDCDGLPSIAGRHPLSAFGEATARRFREGGTLVMTDLDSTPHLSPADRAGFAAIGMRAGIGVGLVKDGRWVAAFGVHSAAPRDWTPAEVALVEETAERTWAAVERARAEAATHESEARFRALGTATANVIYSMSPDWSELRRMHGRNFLADTGAPRRDWLDAYVPPEDQPAVTAAISAAIRNKAVFALEHRVIRADGSLGWTYSRAVPMLDDRGEVVEWFGAASDVTARHEAEAATRESEDRFRTFA